MKKNSKNNYLNSKKASVLLYAIVVVFLVFALSIVIYFTVEKISFGRIVGDDATKITEIKQMGYKQRFFIETAASRILNDAEKGFIDYATDKFPEYEGKILLKNSTYELDIKAQAIIYVQDKFNIEFKNYVALYNEEIKGSQLEQGNTKLKDKEKRNVSLSNIQYKLYYDSTHPNKVYGISPQQQKISISKNVSNIWYEDVYYYWPHFTVESNFISQLSKVYEIKDYYLECNIATTKTTECATKAKDKFKEETKYASEIKVSDDALSVGEFIFVFD